MTISDHSRLESLLQDSSSNSPDAWERYVSQRPTNDELRLVIQWFTDFGAAASQLLLRGEPQAADLLAICSSVDSHREAAWTCLLAQGASNKCLRQVIVAGVHVDVNQVQIKNFWSKIVCPAFRISVSSFVQTRQRQKTRQWPSAIQMPGDKRFLPLLNR